MTLLTPEIMSWIGQSEPPVKVEVTRRDIIKYAIATEQMCQSYIDGDEAPPMFVFGLFRPIIPLNGLASDGLAPMGAIPELPLKRIMAGGTRMTIHRSIHPGQILLGIRTIRNIFEKNGRQGSLIFLEMEMNITNESGEPVLEEVQTRIAR